MRWTSIGLAATLVFSSASAFVASDMGALRHNRASRAGTRNNVRSAKEFGAMPELGRRQSVTACGTQNAGARCEAGYCCSQFGFCGQGADVKTPLET
jgi:hypothetical protein